MKRRRAILGVLAALGLAVAAGYVTFWATTPAPGVKEENLARLRRGMSQGRATAILGESSRLNWTDHGESCWTWHDGDSSVQLIFDRDGGLRFAAVTNGDGGTPAPLYLPTSAFDEIRKNLGL